MTAASTLHVEPAGESGGHCECCGNETRTIWGYIYDCDSPVACYFVQWTRRQPEHFPNFDFLIGTLADENAPDGRLVSWVYNPSAESFMAIDGSNRPAAKSPLCAQALTREQVIADVAEMETATLFIDALWVGDSRISEIRELTNDA
jgi:hypothetical protein